jgi:hypothetical protein
MKLTEIDERTLLIVLIILIIAQIVNAWILHIKG